MPDLTQTEVEEWLDHHPDACLDYFLRKAKLPTINAWLVTHGFPRITHFVSPESQDSGPLVNSLSLAVARCFLAEPTQSNLTAQQPLFRDSHSRTDLKTSLRQDFAKAKSKSIFRTHDPSASELPTSSRKDSLKDMRKCTSLPPTTVNMLSHLIESKVKLPKGFPFDSKETKQNLRKSKGENEFFLSIVRDIATELDIRDLSTKAVENLTVLLNSDGASLFLIEGPRAGPRFLVSKVAQRPDTNDTNEHPDVSQDVENVENAENVENVERTEDVENVERTENVEDVESGENVENVEDVESGENVQNVENAESVENVQNVENAESVENVQNVENAESVENVQNVQIAESVENVQNVQIAESVENVQNVEGVENVQKVKILKNGDIQVAWGEGILGCVAETGETVNLKIASEDARFDPKVDKVMGLETRSLLCMPVRNAYNEIIAVSAVMNKNPSVDNGCFTEKDVEVMGTYLQFIGIAITNAQTIDTSRQEYERNRTLLEMLHDLFEEQTSLEKVMAKIMQRVQKLLDCHKSAILLLEDTTDNSTFARLFELAPSPRESMEEQTPEEKERSGAVTRYLLSVAEKVVASGQLLNIAEVLDAEQGHEGIIKNLLAMPIRNSRCKIIGVANLFDKNNGLPFDNNDEKLFEAYTIFCGLGIHNTLMYSEIEKAMARQKVALEVLSYHASASAKDIEGLMEEPIPCADDLNLYSLSFDDFSLEPDEMVKAAASMFVQLDLVKNFSIEKDTLYRFLVSVKKNYRDVPYHNWRHAFNVSQVMFAILMGCEMKGTFSDLEVLGMFVGCLCHDLDHRGTNNSFQQKSGSALVLLYGTTNTMEHHHFNHAVMILSAESNNIFSGLSPEDYSKVMEILKHSILSTDLSVYFENREKFFELVRTRTYSWELDDHRELLRSMLMTASDLAASCKPWEVQRKVANLVTSEFFEQGDKEREELHLTPQPLMDRERRHELPQLQINWMTDICLPLYESLGEMNPKLLPMSEGAAENKRQWQRIVDDNTMAWDTTDE